MDFGLVWKIFRVKSRFFCAVTSKRLRKSTLCALSCAAEESSVSLGRNSTSDGSSATAETIMGVPGTQAYVSANTEPGVMWSSSVLWPHASQRSIFTPPESRIHSACAVSPTR